MTRHARSMPVAIGVPARLIAQDVEAIREAPVRRADAAEALARLHISDFIEIVIAEAARRMDERPTHTAGIGAMATRIEREAWRRTGP